MPNPLQFDERAVVIVEPNDIFVTKYFLRKQPDGNVQAALGAQWKIYNETGNRIRVTVDNFRRVVDGQCSPTPENPFKDPLPHNEDVPGRRGVITLTRKTQKFDGVDISGDWCYDLYVDGTLVDPGIGFEQW